MEDCGLPAQDAADEGPGAIEEVLLRKGEREGKGRGRGKWARNSELLEGGNRKRAKKTSRRIGRRTAEVLCTQRRWRERVERKIGRSDPRCLSLQSAVSASIPSDCGIWPLLPDTVRSISFDCGFERWKKKEKKKDKKKRKKSAAFCSRSSVPPHTHT